MILPLLERPRRSGRNQTDAFVSHGVDDGQKAMSRLADEDESHLAVVFAVVHDFHGERVFENVALSLERDAVLGEVRGRLGVVPLVNNTNAVVKSNE